MGESNSSPRTAIIVAIIGLIGVVVTVVANNWDKIFPSAVASAKQEQGKSNDPRPGYDVGNNSSKTTSATAVDYPTVRRK